MVFDTGVLQAPRAVPWECQLSATIKLCCLIDLKIAPSSWWILVVDKIAQTMDGFKDTNQGAMEQKPEKSSQESLGYMDQCRRESNRSCCCHRSGSRRAP